MPVDMTGGIYSVSGPVMVVCEDEVLRSLVRRQLESYRIEVLSAEARLPDKIPPQTANVIYLSDEVSLSFCELSPPSSADGFNLSKVQHEGVNYWFVCSRSARGRYYGFMKFLDGADDVQDSPSFALRGLVEGFYGQPWSWQNRSEIVDLMSGLKMNIYVYAPKDDPLHRSKWRQKYDAETMEKFRHLASQCSERFVDFCYALSPGLDVEYGNEEEVERVCDKFKQFAEIGVRVFGLFLDDVPPLLGHRDKERYGSLAEAQTHFVESVYRRVGELCDDARLIFCPTVYHGSPQSEYLSEISVIPREVGILWTGPEVCSRRIGSAHLKEVSRVLRRKLIIWDNYPVNDYDPHRRNVNAVRNRDPDLSDYCEGFLVNPMNQAHASKVAIFTYGEFLWNPREYRPDLSLERALGYVFGTDLLPYAKVLVDNLEDLLDTSPAAIEPAIDALDGGDELDLELARARFEELEEVGRLLEGLEDEELLEELREHIEKLSDIGTLGRLRVEEEIISRKILRNAARVLSPDLVRRLIR